MNDSRRAGFVVDVLDEAFGESIAASPAAFRRKFRKMAASPFAFYRGSACLFYADLVDGFADETFVDRRTGRVWIHGDLHAENFGTYMNDAGELVFNVNDFDEAYVGPFTWDLKRFAASLALIDYAKALSDESIGALVGSFARAYLGKIRVVAEQGEQAIRELTLDNSTGVVHDVLQNARLNTRVDLLDGDTVIREYERVFAPGQGRAHVDAAKRDAVEDAFCDYLATLPATHDRVRPVQHVVKDIVRRTGVGIGSAGLPSYNLLLEGRTQALENDVVLFMKQAQVPAVSRHIDDERVRGYFRHQGHRTAESQRALQVHADPWLGYATLDGTGQLVAEVSPYAADLEWNEVIEAEDLELVVRELGRAVGRMHAVADDASSHDLVDFSTEAAIGAAIGDRDGGFAAMLTEFAHAYGARARADHQLFVDLFRNGRLPV